VKKLEEYMQYEVVYIGTKREKNAVLITLQYAFI
jgi:hypothetical protein